MKTFYILILYTNGANIKTVKRFEEKPENSNSIHAK